ncbi:hypothetical protein [Magnetococcus sp. PR-3]|uniref:hypothetical protein n=1 Tax=Magnetococcus sp. PR-3 TaxID=3120355 RepID=UPI002FCE2088
MGLGDGMKPRVRLQSGIFLTLMLTYGSTAYGVENPLNQVFSELFPDQELQKQECEQGAQVLENHHQQVDLAQKRLNRAEQHLQSIQAQITQYKEQEALVQVLEDARILSETHLNSRYMQHQQAFKEMAKVKSRYSVHCGALSTSDVTSQNSQHSWLQHNRMDIATFVSAAAKSNSVNKIDEVPPSEEEAQLVKDGERGAAHASTVSSEPLESTYNSTTAEDQTLEPVVEASPYLGRKLHTQPAMPPVSYQSFYMAQWLQPAAGAALAQVSTHATQPTGFSPQPKQVKKTVYRATHPLSKGSANHVTRIKLKPVQVIRTKRLASDLSKKLVYLGSFSNRTALAKMKLQVSNVLAISPDQFVQRSFYDGRLTRLYLGPMQQDMAQQAMQQVAGKLSLDHLKIVMEKRL